jgi:hypothetical protein
MSFVLKVVTQKKRQRTLYAQRAVYMGLLNRKERKK